MIFILLILPPSPLPQVKLVCNVNIVSSPTKYCPKCRHHRPPPMICQPPPFICWCFFIRIPLPSYKKTLYNLLLCPVVQMTALLPSFAYSCTVVQYNSTCSAQARTGIGLLEKPPAVNRFPAVESHLGVRASYVTRRKRRYEANKCG
jgi:hypothetical protein